MKHNIKEMIGQMTLEEKAGMCSGFDFWRLKSIGRLGIPAIMMSDGPHGLRKQDEKQDHLGINESIKAVCFPPAALTACSFDRELIRTLGDAIGKEAQANDLAVVLGPAVNIKRSPLCGRNFEYYSEDPYLSGEAAVAYIEGVQAHHIGTSIKHFAANSQEFKRVSSSSNVDERTMREIYLPAFETAVKKAQPYTVMCSYNRVNGTFASENPWLLTDLLRKEWGFRGYVVSDWGAVNDRVDGLKAGMDLEMPSSNGMNDAEIVAAVENGSLAEEVLDQAVERILNITFTYAENREEQIFDLEGDHRLAKKAAEESMVLLKNEGILPLQKQEKVLFVGEFAVKPRYQGGGSSHVNSYRISSVMEALDTDADVTYQKGFAADDDIYDEILAQEAVKAAAKADKVIVFAGLPDSYESEGYDRSHMRLPNNQNRLIEELLAVNPKLAVVLHNGSPIEMPWLSKVKGLLEAYLGGQAVGEAVADILFGKVNPSGKLAETIPYKLSDNPSYFTFGEEKNVNYTEGIFVGYRYYDKKEMPVAFPFGYGLSYTSFAYSNLKLSADSFSDGEMVTVSVDVTNTGSVAGKEIVQLYISDHTQKARRPLRELKGFEKVSLCPGETKTVTFAVEYRSLAWYNTDIHDWYAATGEYEVQIGASSRDIRLSQKLHFVTQKLLPLEVAFNTTLGELMQDPRTLPFALECKHKLDCFFGVADPNEDAADQAVDEEMQNGMAASLPLRNIVALGLYSQKEMEELIEEMNK